MKVIIAIIASSLSFAVSAQGFVVDSQGKAVRDSQGECVRTAEWTPQSRFAECDKVPLVVAQPVLQPKTEVPVVAVVTPVAVTKKVTVQSDVLFDFDSYDLLPQGKVELDKIAKEVKSGTVVKVVGHADPIGNPNYNLVLSQTRAKVVGHYINTKVKNVSLDVSGVGSREPEKDTEKCKSVKNYKKKIECYAPDRRVEVEYIVVQ